MNKMYKVMITQIIRKEVVGKMVLVEDFNNIQDAIRAAEEYSKVYEHQVYQIREYENGNPVIISFDESDSGRIVHENIQELLDEYNNNDIDIVELLDCILADDEDDMHIVAMNISDYGLTKLLEQITSCKWYCKGHKLFEY